MGIARISMVKVSDPKQLSNEEIDVLLKDRVYDINDEDLYLVVEDAGDDREYYYQQNKKVVETIIN